jgi:hypothetical protein
MCTFFPADDGKVTFQQKRDGMTSSAQSIFAAHQLPMLLGIMAGSDGGSRFRQAKKPPPEPARIADSSPNYRQPKREPSKLGFFPEPS